MAGFLLIHGAMHGGWCFDPVADILRAKGHKVAAPDLPGMGGDEDALRAVTIESWTEFALEQCRAMRRELDGEPLVLAGHSRGGLNISAAAEADPSAMDALVYICALMMPGGMSPAAMQDMLPKQPEMEPFGRLVANGAGMMVDPEQAARFFAHLSPPDLAEDAAHRLVAEPLGPLATLVEVTHERWGTVPRLYVECLQDRTVPIANQRQMLALSPGTATVTLDTDHSPFYSAPEALADALIAVAEGSLSSG